MPAPNYQQHKPCHHMTKTLLATSFMMTYLNISQTIVITAPGKAHTHTQLRHFPAACPDDPLSEPIWVWSHRLHNFPISNRFSGELCPLVGTTVINISPTRDDCKLIEIRMWCEIVHLDVFHVDGLRRSVQQKMREVSEVSLIWKDPHFISIFWVFGVFG